MTTTRRIRLLSATLWKSVAWYFGARRSRAARRLDCRDALAEFVRTRAAHVAQTSLYGYLRTRAGARFPELFANDRFVESVNIAKWHIWLACVSDLAVYAGGLMRERTQAGPLEVGRIIQGVVEETLYQTGVPADAGTEFAAHAERVLARVMLCDWQPRDDEASFVESPAALVQWAPIADELKHFDEAIVRNSVRFRWQEVRRELRRDMDAAALVLAGRAAGAAGESVGS